MNFIFSGEINARAQLCEASTPRTILSIAEA